MSNYRLVEDASELLDEKQSMETALARIAPALGLRGASARLGANTDGLVTSCSQKLLARCGDRNRKRLLELVRLEPCFPEDFDRTALIVVMCSVIETELTRLLAEPSRQVAVSLLNAVAPEISLKQRQMFSEWSEGRMPTTMGTVEFLLFALRRAITNGVETVLELLRERFHPSYFGLLENKSLGRAIGKLRSEYRNPAAHGLREFCLPDYEGFCLLAVGAQSVGNWSRHGPDRTPPAHEEAFLHHHLACTLASLDGQVCSETASISLTSLLALTTPAASSLQIVVAVEHAARPAEVRRVGIKHGDGRFRVGDNVSFAVRVEQDCHLYLLNVSPTGQVALLLPNRLRPDSEVRKGVVYLPERKAPECEFPIEGPPGTEIILAVVTSQPLPLSALSEFGGSMLRELAGADLGQLFEMLTELPPDTWAIDRCRFAVLA